MFPVRFFLAAVVCWWVIFSGIAGADQVVAIVNGQNIMKSELDEFTAKVPGPFKEAFKKKALRQVIDAKVFYGLAKKEGLMESEEYKHQIEKASRMILTDLFIEKKLKSTIRITDKDMKAYYRENKAGFNTGKKIMPGHILVKDKDTAMALRKKITPANFDQIAAGIAESYPDARFYKLGWTEKGKTRMPATFEKAAFALEKGEISPVVQTKIGFHIIKAFDVKPGQERTYEQVKDTIKSRLTQEKLNELKQGYLESAKVEITSNEYK